VTATIETAPLLTPGRKVQVNNPECGPGWNVVGTVSGRIGGPWDLYLVTPDSGDFAGVQGAFSRGHLTPVAENDIVTVEDIEGLNALPLSTEIEDIDGEVFRKMGEDRYVTFDGDGFVDLDFTAGDVEESLPGVVLNPELMGEFRTEKLDGFRAGDPVVVVSNTFSDIAPIGTTGVVRRITFGFLDIALPNGLIFPFRSDEVAPLGVAEAVTAEDVIGATVGDLTALISLPNGAVLVDDEVVRIKLGGDWVDHRARGTYNLDTTLRALGDGLRLAYLPEF
jgi:hypothetical protein